MTYKIYISGPMTGLPEFNFPAFDAMSDFLRNSGFDPISPADHDRAVLVKNFDAGHTVYRFVKNVPGYLEGDVETYSKHTGAVHDLLAWDLQQIIQADGIVLLPGWENSTGAAHERYVAEVTNKRIFLAELFDDGTINMVEDDTPIRLSHKPKLVDKLSNNGRPTLPAPGEVRVVNETTGGAKGSKLARFDLLPVRPLWAVAEHYGLGAQKYAARNWELGYDWSLSFAAMMRHALSFWNGEDNDPELGTPHLAAVVFHAFSLMEWGRTHPELDDRPSAA